MTSGARKERIYSLDGVKGFMSLKIAFSHLGFFVAVPWLAHAVSLGRSLGFPILLFAFGVGTGISKRRKAVWPLGVLAVALLVGSVLNEAFMDLRIANGIPGSGTPMDGGALNRLAVVVSMAGTAHYADFLLPYLLFLSASILVDRLGKPIRTWRPWVLGMSALALHSLGLVLSSSSYQGPLSALWGSGYRSLQYAPLFALGILVGTNRNRLLATVERPSLHAFGYFIAKLALSKFVIDGVMYARHFYGFHDSLWKEGDIASNVGAAVIGVLLLSAYGDLCQLTRGPVLQALERVGKRTIYSLCIQVVLLPLAGLLAVQFSSVPIRAAIGIAAWVSVASLVLGWDRVISLVKRGEESASHLVHDAESATMQAESA